MKRRSTRLIPVWSTSALLLLVCSGGANAQFVPVGAGATSGTSSSPMATSYANPFMNPYAAALSQQPLDTGTMAMYFMAARQAGNGIGSGRPSGTRPGPAATSKERGTGETTRAEGSNVPGAMASRYFNRTTPVYLGTNRYYNRQARYFPSNGQVR